MYDKILVPTDGSEESEVAVEHAESLAEKYDAEIHFLYVADVRTQNTGNIMPNLMSELEEAGEKATESLAEKMESQGIETVTEVRKGIPHRELNDYTDEEDIDLVVMSTHGRTGLDRVLLGSVTEKMVRTCQKPVMTVRNREKAD
jgi:nucleotide-binding universal stress UspA family protein